MNNRLKAIRILVLLSFVIGIVSTSLFVPQETAQAECGGTTFNEIVNENCLIGNPASEWDVIGAGDANIQGFATDISVDQGGTIDFKVDTVAETYTIDIYRLGYYGGNGARKVAALGSFPGTDQVACLPDATNGNLIDWAAGLCRPHGRFLPMLYPGYTSRN
ncbi:MAG TPA: hypothetical protein PJ988_13190 [Anaerolinea sp.]|nr:hypothetical protein [Anaerolinea sp.]